MARRPEIPWFKVDDQLHAHRKARLARKAAMGVWVLAGSWCADNLTDGFVPASVLPLWGTRADARALVDAGLWHPSEKDGERGWQFHDWHEFQPTAESVRAEREAARERMKHLRSRRRSPERSGEHSPKFGRSSVTPESRVPVVVKSPVSPHSADAIDDDGLTRIQRATGGPKTHARRTADLVLAKAPADVRNPVAYVLAAVEAEPERFRAKRGNPTKADECPDHPGEWADACRAHAIDARLGGA
jgi:hypothetical protein